MFDEFVLDVWHKFYKEKIAISKVEFAKRLGVSYDSLREFLNGHTRKRQIAEKIADYFGMATVYRNGKYRLVETEKIKE